MTDHGGCPSEDEMEAEERIAQVQRKKAPIAYFAAATIDEKHSVFPVRRFNGRLIDCYDEVVTTYPTFQEAVDATGITNTGIRARTFWSEALQRQVTVPE